MQGMRDSGVIKTSNPKINGKLYTNCTTENATESKKYLIAFPDAKIVERLPVGKGVVSF